MQDSNHEVYDRICILLDEVEARLAEGFPEEGLQLALQAEVLLARHPDASSTDLEVDLQYTLASCQFELHDMGAALRHYEHVRRLDDSDADLDYWQARALFHGWQFKEARRLLETFQPGGSTRAGTFYYRALLEDFRGDHKAADELFLQAQREAPSDYPLPLRMESARAREALDEILQGLPGDVQRSLRNVNIELRLLPDPITHASPEVDPLVTSLYRTLEPAPSGGRMSASNPGIIEVFQRNVELHATDRDELREEIRLTVLHQIGHYLGWDQSPTVHGTLN